MEFRSLKILRSRRQLEDYLAKTPKEKTDFHAQLQSNGSNLQDWYRTTLQPFTLDENVYPLRDAQALLVGKKDPPRGSNRALYAIADGDIYGEQGRRERSVSRKTLEKFIKNQVRMFSTARIHAALRKHGIVLNRNRFHEIVQKSGGILQKRYKRHVYHVPGVARAILAVWDHHRSIQRGISSRQIEAELGLHSSSAARIIRQLFGNQPRFQSRTGGWHITPDEYARISPVLAAHAYGRQVGLSPNRVTELIDAIQCQGKFQKVQYFQNRINRALLLESIGLHHGTPEHQVVLRQRSRLATLEARVAALRLLGVTDFARYRNFLYDSVFDPRNALGQSVVKARVATDERLARMEKELMESPDIDLDMDSIRTFDDLGLIECRELLKRSKRGDEQSTRKLMEVFSPMIEGTARKIVYVYRVPGTSLGDALHYAGVAFFDALRRVRNYRGLGSYVKKSLLPEATRMALREAPAHESLFKPQHARRLLSHQFDES